MYKYAVWHLTSHLQRDGFSPHPSNSKSAKVDKVRACGSGLCSVCSVGTLQLSWQTSDCCRRLPAAKQAQVWGERVARLGWALQSLPVCWRDWFPIYSSSLNWWLHRRWQQPDKSQSCSWCKTWCLCNLSAHLLNNSNHLHHLRLQSDAFGSDDLQMYHWRVEMLNCLLLSENKALKTYLI